MARKVPEDRFHELIQAATAVFLEQGYQRSQMSSVAERLGVAKGTVYLYVESKEALFEAVLEHADAPERIPLPARLPRPTPRPGVTRRGVSERIAMTSTLPRLHEALARRRVADARAELEGTLRELYAMLSAHRVGIKLLDRCAAEYPELASVWNRSGRVALLELLERYLSERARRGLLRPIADPAATARVMLEHLAYWAVHRHWDRSPQKFDESALERTVIDFAVHALLED